MIKIWEMLTGTVGLVLVSIVLVLTILFYVYQEGKDNGASDVINQQNTIDRKVIDSVRDGRDAVDRCRARGMQWNRETGQCQQRM
jgi:hypothetical protein